MNTREAGYADALGLTVEARGIYDRVQTDVDRRIKAGQECAYGACSRGADPRNYYPDLEVCTREEVERWVQAVQLWDNGDKHPEGPMPTTPWCSADSSFGHGVEVWQE